MAMAVEWPNFWYVHMELIRREHSGGMTSQERSDLVERFGVSEELLLRCERAYHTYHSVIFEKLWRQARLQAMRRMNQLGKELVSPELAEETSKALERIRAATPENEIIREYREAMAELKVALDGSALTPEK